MYSFIVWLKILCTKFFSISIEFDDLSFSGLRSVLVSYKQDSAVFIIHNIYNIPRACLLNRSPVRYGSKKQ